MMKPFHYFIRSTDKQDKRKEEKEERQEIFHGKAEIQICVSMI